MNIISIIRNKIRFLSKTNIDHKVINANISYNKAMNNGGGIYINQVPLSIDNGYIYKNEAINNGGGIYNFISSFEVST